MNKIILVFILSMTFSVVPAPKLFAQETEVAQLLLNLEKLRQFRSILSQMKKGYEILTGGYNTVIDIAQGNFKLHKAFLDGLLKVSPTVRNYKRVAGIIDYQVIIVKEYKTALGRFRSSNSFSLGELEYISYVHGNLLKESLRNLDELTGVVTAGKMRMSDDERLKAIDRIYTDMEGKLIFLREFNNSISLLSLQRAKENNDIELTKKIYGLTE